MYTANQIAKIRILWAVPVSTRRVPAVCRQMRPNLKRDAAGVGLGIRGALALLPPDLGLAYGAFGEWRVRGRGIFRGGRGGRNYKLGVWR